MSSQAIRHAAPANAVTANSNAAQVFNLVSNALVPVTVAAPGKLILEAKQFRVRAEGYALTAGNYTLKASLLAGLTIPATPLTATNWTLLGAGTARAINTTYAPWWIEADLIFDSYSGALQGVFDQLVNNLYDSRAALTNQVTGINGTNANISQGGTVVVPADPVLYFAIALTFGTANAGNAGYLNNFEIGF